MWRELGIIVAMSHHGARLSNHIARLGKACHNTVINVTPDTMKNLRLLTASLVLLSALLSALPLVMPYTSGPGLHPDYLATGLFFSLMGVTAALLFLFGLRGFTPEFRRAYAWLCAGTIIHAIAWSLPIFVIYLPQIDQRTLPLLADIPYALGSVMVFVAMHRYAKLIELNHWLFQPWCYLAVPAGLILASGIVPYQSSNGLLPAALPATIALTQVLADLLCVLAIGQLRNTISRPYVHAISWLHVTMIIDLIAVGTYYYLTATNQYDFSTTATTNVSLSQALLITPYLVHNLLFVVCAYSFAKITRSNDEVVAGASVIDVITDTASLVATPTPELDAILDPLRRITALEPRRQTPDTKQLQILANVYQALEMYLLTKDPLRKFTRQQLRQRIKHRFHPQLYEPLFADEKSAPMAGTPK